MRINIKGFLIVLGLIFLTNPFAGLSQARFYYVATSGHDSNPGTEDQPWRTIQKAAQTLTAGDTVYIQSGIYNERVIPKNSGSPGNYITFAAFPGAKPVIDGQGVSVPSDSGLFHVNNKKYIIITGLKIQNVKNTNNSNGIYVNDSSYITIRNNHTYNTRSSGIGVWDSQNITLTGNEVELACNDGEQECLTVAITRNFTVAHNHVHHGGPGSNGGEGIDIKDGSCSGKVYGNYVHHINRLGIYIDAWDKSTKDIDVYNNIVCECEEDGFAVASEAGGLLENIRIFNNVAYNNGYIGITIAGWGEPGYPHPMQDIFVINNTFYNNGSGSWGGGLVVENSEVRGLVIRNNIFSQNLLFQIVVDETVQDLSVDHNLIHGFRNYPKETYGTDFVTGDPLFANPSAGDFHLQNNSPAIDSGSAARAPGQDFEGGSRPIGAGFDIGADEFGSDSGPGQVTLLSPSGPISDNTPAFSWTAAIGAVRYKLKVSGPGNNQIIKTYKAAKITSDGTCSVILAQTLADGNYIWKVRVRGQGPQWGPWSPGMNFRVESKMIRPQLIAPQGNISTNNPTYIWSAVEGAIRYHLKVNGASGSGTVINKKYRTAAVTVNGTCSVTPATSLADGDYSWKVRALDTSRKWGPWSASLAFSVSGRVIKMELDRVKYWAYNIQDCDTGRQRDELVGTHFDLYVLEPVVTEKGQKNFAIKNLVNDIRQANIRNRGVDPIILAYIDIGQAEAWRWYYDESWEVGDPEWIVAADPDDWEDCYPVAYWYPMWENIVIYGNQGRSMVEESLKAGFDGIYMDWVEGFSDDNVIAKAEEDGIDPAVAMFNFIEKIRNYARIGSPNYKADYLVVAQNASDLYQENPSRYRQLIDAIALEAIWYDGSGGFDTWSDPDGYNVLTNDIYPGWTEEVLGYLQPMKKHMPIFCVEYAQDLNGQNFATEVYTDLAPAEGFIAYCSRRSLARLSKTPYPRGYTPKDY